METNFAQNYMLNVFNPEKFKNEKVSSAAEKICGWLLRHSVISGILYIIYMIVTMPITYPIVFVAGFMKTGEEVGEVLGDALYDIAHIVSDKEEA